MSFFLCMPGEHHVCIVGICHCDTPLILQLYRLSLPFALTSAFTCLTLNTPPLTASSKDVIANTWHVPLHR